MGSYRDCVASMYGLYSVSMGAFEGYHPPIMENQLEMTTENKKKTEIVELFI